MNKGESVGCRVCGGPLTGYFGLCVKHAIETETFWQRLRQNIADREKRQAAEREAVARTDG